MPAREAVNVSGIAEWQRAASRILVPLHCHSGPGEHSESGAFVASIDHREITPGMWVSRIETGAHVAERPAELIRAGGAAGLFVTLQLAGEATLYQRGRSATAGAGTITICEADVPLRVEVSAPGQTAVVLQLDPARAGVPRRLAARASAVAITDCVPGQTALAGLMTGVDSPALRLGSDTGESLARAVAEVLAAVVRAVLQPRDDSRQRRLALLAQLRTSLREQIGDPGLTVDQLAAQHFLSVRQVHALFAEDADSPAAYLRRSRLAHAERLLLLREHSGMTVGAISRESGYADSATFIRAFTRERGSSPVRWAESRRAQTEREAQGDAPGARRD